MHTLIEQTRKATDTGLYYFALMAAALEVRDGIAKSHRYAAWYERLAPPAVVNTAPGQAIFGLELRQFPLRDVSVGSYIP